MLAVTDRDSQTFADQARTATAEVERERRDLEQLLETGGSEAEKGLLKQFSEYFVEYQRIDRELLDLASRNTNVKAYNLAFGPATDAVNEMSAALARVAESRAGSADEKKIRLMTDRVEIAALHIQTLIPAHIAEESDRKMDDMETMMAKDDEQIRKNLADLTALPALRRNAALVTAASCYAEFSKIKAQILALSRENTNVRSLSISLNQKRKVMLLCQSTLDELQQAILDEPIPGVTYGRPARPR